MHCIAQVDWRTRIVFDSSTGSIGCIRTLIGSRHPVYDPRSKFISWAISWIVFKDGMAVFGAGLSWGHPTDYTDAHVF